MRAENGSHRARPWRARPAVLSVLALATLALLATPSAGRRRAPITLRIVGAFDAAPTGVRPLETIEVRIGKETSRRLVVTKIVNQTSGPLGSRILDEAKRYKPAFRLVGDEAMTAKLAAAPHGARVSFTGSLTSGRNLLLSQVNVDPGSPPPRDG